MALILKLRLSVGASTFEEAVTFRDGRTCGKYCRYFLGPFHTGGLLPEFYNEFFVIRISHFFYSWKSQNAPVSPDKVQRVRIRSTNVTSPDHYKCSPGSDKSSSSFDESHRLVFLLLVRRQNVRCQFPL